MTVAAMLTVAMKVWKLRAGEILRFFPNRMVAMGHLRTQVVDVLSFVAEEVWRRLQRSDAGHDNLQS